jgi:hypothetical protein
MKSELFLITLSGSRRRSCHLRPNRKPRIMDVNVVTRSLAGGHFLVSKPVCSEDDEVHRNSPVHDTLVGQDLTYITTRESMIWIMLWLLANRPERKAGEPLSLRIDPLCVDRLHCDRRSSPKKWPRHKVRPQVRPKSYRYPTSLQVNFRPLPVTENNVMGKIFRAVPCWHSRCPNEFIGTGRRCPAVPTTNTQDGLVTKSQQRPIAKAGGRVP